MKIPHFLFALAASLFLASPSVAQDEDKIGTVDMSRLVADYHISKSTRDSFSAYQETIKGQDGVRIEKIKESAEMAKKLQQDVDDPSLSAEKRDSLFKEASARRDEAKRLQEDRVSWLKRKQAQLNEEAAKKFGDIRKELMTIVQAVGTEEGYDYIFDRSGGSGAGVNVLVYTKDATDLTGLLLERINKDAPKEEEEK
ncbi:OmpH family outer membrane protein [Akkermansiaceae bacterium]|nr:OmpH family outer membrane protein [Akkermansiaceae bacterium]MDB4462849.1 OmpH family outer membrane protein [Akkermansiaceae bacterium]MDB4506567.1 OmpH family outer membrane protein [bacterium]MDB4509070.1 OmpH family outer membrane protein [Akkermansiaceae bacterium]MDB4546425.1 OmpH family outer membrane protein [Akkermansiaceae bacterium]